MAISFPPRLGVLVSATIVLASCTPSASPSTTPTTPPSQSTSSTPAPSVSRSSAPVPSAYQATYSALESQVAGFTTAAGSDPHGSKMIVASGLETADGNAMKPGVLQTNALNTTTTLIHDLKALGETGITVQVNFPLLVTSFPSSSEYTTFYQDVAQVVHQEKMNLTVEENPLFGNISALPVSSFYSSLTMQSYEDDTRQEAQTIIDVMQPNQLDVLSEPDTYTLNIRNHDIDLKVAANGVSFVKAVLNGLDRKSTALGGGTGSWQDATYDQALLSQTSMDFMDIHVYFITSTDLTYLQSEVAAARAANKPIVMTECWLYKNSTNGQPVDTQSGAPDEQKLVTYSFWESLDTQFLTDVVSFSRNNQFEVMSAFSTESFFAYQDYQPAFDSESSTQVRASFNQQVSPAIAANQLSSVGVTYESLAKW